MQAAAVTFFIVLAETNERDANRSANEDFSVSAAQSTPLNSHVPCRRLVSSEIERDRGCCKPTALQPVSNAMRPKPLGTGRLKSIASVPELPRLKSVMTQFFA